MENSTVDPLHGNAAVPSHVAFWSSLCRTVSIGGPQVSGSSTKEVRCGTMRTLKSVGMAHE